MMKKYFAILLMILIGNVACATTKKSSESIKSSEASAGAFHWFEMGVEKEIFLEEGVIAVFSDGVTKPRATTLKSKSLGQLRLQKEFGSVRLYRTENAVSAKSLTSLAVPGASPVFRVGAQGGRRMALPGTILVQFKQETSEDQAKEWAHQVGVSLVRKQTFPKNSYVFLHQPGLESLVMANKLQERSEIEWAQPDWWLEVNRR
jgi:hypothetical protein